MCWIATSAGDGSRSINASTTCGSNCDPAQRRSSAKAADDAHAFRLRTATHSLLANSLSTSSPTPEPPYPTHSKKDQSAQNAQLLATQSASPDHSPPSPPLHKLDLPEAAHSHPP